MNLTIEPLSRSLIAPAFLLAAVLAAVTPPQARAVSYATGLTNTGSSISFRLNEPADSVRVLYNGGSSVLNLGARTAGLVTTNVAVTGTFRVEVTKTAGAGYLQGTVLQISSDSNRLLQWEQPVGVAVNRNPASPYFGRIYVSNSRPLPTATGRNVQEGIYVLNPDFTDALGQGDNALTGGLDFTDQSGDTQNTTLPWRIEVGEDDNLYISDFTANSGTVYVTDPNVANGANVLEGLGTPGVSPTAGFTHGQIASSVIATGSLSTSNLTLYLLDADVSPINGLKRFDINEGPLPSQAVGNDLTGSSSPLLTISRVFVDLDRGPDGKFYLVQNRSAGNEGGVYVIDSADSDQDGYLDLLYSSLGNWRQLNNDFALKDTMTNSYAIDVAPNGQYAAISSVLGTIYILPLDASGLPILTNRIVLNASPTGGPTRDVAFDAAGNLYMVNNNAEVLRAFSPGGRWVATTGSDGTFTVTNPPVIIPEITISSSQTNMYERVGANQGSIILTRVGSANEDLTVNLQIAGTAVSGTDYQALPASVVIPAGAASTNVAVTPLNNTALTGPRTILVTVAPSAGYSVVGNETLALQVSDDEQEPGTVVFEDDFENDTSANYNILWSSGDGVQDYSAEFAFDYSQLGIPPAPHSAPGETKGVRLRANKDATGSPSAVNLFPKGENFSGDYALRADVYMNIGTDAAGTTEHTIFGINHSGNTVVRHGITAADGLWFAVDSDGSNNRGFGFYGTDASAPTLLRGNSDLVWAFPSPPYAFAGAPGNSTNMVTGAGLGGIWADVEVSQVKDVVTAKVNNVVIFQFTNTYAFKNGTVMIGHNDQFASIGSQDTYSLWDNLRVVNFASADLSVRMTDIRASGSNVVITFTADTAGAFVPYSSASAAGPYTVDAGATISTNSPGVYQLTAPATGASRFFRIGREQ